LGQGREGNGGTAGEQGPRMILTLLTLMAAAPQYPDADQDESHDTWAERARFFAGARGGVGFVPGGKGPSPTFGVELGVSNTRGVGFGLHLLGSTNNSGVDFLGIPPTSMAFGGEADLRIYIQTVEPLTLYPTFSVGFLTGPSSIDGTNAVLPLVNMGFGGRVRFGSVYAALELGLASFHIPYVSVSLGIESKPRAVQQEEERHVQRKQTEQPEEAEQPVPPPPPLPSSRRYNPEPQRIPASL
jgi:hypothetical protein